jgi:hypothetical protein
MLNELNCVFVSFYEVKMSKNVIVFGINIVYYTDSVNIQTTAWNVLHTSV